VRLGLFVVKSVLLGISWETGATELVYRTEMESLTYRDVLGAICRIHCEFGN
jgi:hypothetical protein